MDALALHRNRLAGNTMVMAALVICAVLISGCRAKTPAKYGREHNDKRKKRLIPIIPDDWHWFGRLDTWESSQDIAQTVPHYAMPKAIAIIPGKRTRSQTPILARGLNVGRG
jgi:hypothetical protein